MSCLNCLLHVLRQGGYVMTAVCVSVCLCVYVQNIAESYERILMKFFLEGWGVAQGTTIWILMAIRIPFLYFTPIFHPP